MSFYWLTLGVLSVWRVTHLLCEEDGPREMFGHIRKWLGEGFWGQVLSCFYCLSIWIAVPLALLLGEGWIDRLLLVPALSGGAILLERITCPAKSIPVAEYVEEKEEKDVVSVREEDRVSRGHRGKRGNQTAHGRGTPRSSASS